MLSMRVILFLFAITMYAKAPAQSDAVLEKYLVAHRSIINIKPDSSFSLSPGGQEMINSCMKGKSLFVLAENTSHQLVLYKKLRPALIEQFIRLNLKYVFIEFGRSVAYDVNADLDNNYKMPDNTFFSISERVRLKKIMGNRRSFEYKGIDFERGFEFYDAVNNILYDVDMNSLHESRAFITKIKDIASQQIPPDSNGKTTYRHFHNFYKDAREEFYRDSLVIKKELGTHYADIKYLLTNPNNQLPPWAAHKLIYDDRDPEMTKNLLTEITPLDTSAVYFLSIGYAHTYGSSAVVHKLSKSQVLENRIVVMNEFCEDCSINGEKMDKYNSKMHFMKGAVRSAFRNTANSDLVIFDLSELPREYNYIKKHGDLLLFAKNQN